VMEKLLPQQATKDVNSMKWMNQSKTRRKLAVIHSNLSMRMTISRSNVKSTRCKLGTLDWRVMTYNAGLRVKVRLRLTAIRLLNARDSPT
jgi:hypothetical protein